MGQYPSVLASLWPSSEIPGQRYTDNRSAEQTAGTRPDPKSFATTRAAPRCMPMSRMPAHLCCNQCSCAISGACLCFFFWQVQQGVLPLASSTKPSRQCWTMPQSQMKQPRAMYCCSRQSLARANVHQHCWCLATLDLYLSMDSVS